MKIHLPQSCTHYMQTCLEGIRDKYGPMTKCCWDLLRRPENAKEPTNQPTNNQAKERTGSESKHWPLLNIAALLRMLSLFSSRTGGASWSAEDLSRLAECMFPRRLGNVAVSNTLWNWRKGMERPFHAPLILPSRCSLAFVRVPWIKDVIRLRRVPCGRRWLPTLHLLTYNTISDIFFIDRDTFWTLSSFQFQYVLNPFDAIDSSGYTVSDKTVQQLYRVLITILLPCLKSGCHAQSLCLDERHYMRLPHVHSQTVDVNSWHLFNCFSCLVGSFIGPLKVLTHHTLGASNKQRSSQQILNLGTFSLFDQVTNRQG